MICHTCSKPKHVPSSEFEVCKKDLDCANSGDLSTILGPNNKSFQGFYLWTPLRGFRVIGWLAGVSLAFYFQKLASLQYSWSLITLNRRLRFFKIYRHGKNVTVDEVPETIKKECEGPGQLLGYRTMYHKIRQVRGTRDHVYAAMTDVYSRKRKRTVHFLLLVLTGFLEFADSTS